MRKIVQIDFDEFVCVNNEKGKAEAKILAREKYNLSFEQVKRRLLNGTDYYYDPKTRTYKHKEKLAYEAEFMSLEELDKKNFYQPLEKGIMGHKGPGSGFDELVQELIKDKIIELSRYISIDHRTRKLFVKTDTLNRDGFSLVEI
ncbi:MAG: hypothetical protein ABRQ25_18580 [Clostridiaceae bacterium]